MLSLHTKEDMHVHSTFSDGRDSPSTNVVAAELHGLRRLGCVDHVRHDSTYVPDFAAHIAALRKRTSLQLYVGVEAKFLDDRGTLDLPKPALLRGVDFVYAADHQLPLSEGCLDVRESRRRLESGRLTPANVIEALHDATVGAAQLAGPRVIVAHLFSLLPKLNIDERQVCTWVVESLGDALASCDAMIEIDERWACPSPRIIATLMSRGVGVLFSSDAHTSDAVGHYEYATAAMERAQTMLRPTRSDLPCVQL